MVQELHNLIVDDQRVFRHNPCMHAHPLLDACASAPSATRSTSILQ